MKQVLLSHAHMTTQPSGGLAVFTDERPHGENAEPATCRVDAGVSAFSHSGNGLVPSEYAHIGMALHHIEELLRVCAASNIGLDTERGRLLVNTRGTPLEGTLKIALERYSSALVRRLAAERSSPRGKNGQPDMSCHSAQDKAPLSPYQRGFYALSCEEGAHLAVLNQTGAVDLACPPDEEEVNHVFAYLLQRHDALTSVVEAGQDGTPFMRRIPATAFRCEFLRAKADTSSGADPAEDGAFEATVSAVLQRFRSTSFNLSEGPLLRAALITGSDRAVLALCVHHIIIDGWSVGILLHEWLTVFAALREGGAPDLSPLPYTQAAYATWATRVLEQQVQDGQQAFWRGCLSSCPLVPVFPTDASRQATRSGELRHTRRALPESCLPHLQRWAADADCSLFAALHTALRITLFKAGYDARQPLLTVSANRDQAHGMENMVGCCINTLPLVCPLDPEEPLIDLLVRSQAAILEAMDNQDIAFESIVETAPYSRIRSWHPLGQIMLMLQNTFTKDTEGSSLRLPDHPIANYELSFILWDLGNGASLQIEYDTTLYSHRTVKDLGELFAVVCTLLPESGGHSARSLHLAKGSRNDELFGGVRAEESITRKSNGGVAPRIRASGLADAPDCRMARAHVLALLAEHFPETNQVICVWRGDNCPERLAIMAACLAEGIPFVLAPKSGDIVPHHPDAVEAFLVLSQEHGAADQSGGLSYECTAPVVLARFSLSDASEERPFMDVPASVGSMDTIGACKPVEAEQDRNEYAVLHAPDGESLCTLAAYGNEAILHALQDIQRLILADAPAGLTFLPGEDADPTGLFALTARMAGLPVRWNDLDLATDAKPGAILTTSWEAAEHYISQGVTVFISNNLPSPAFFEKRPETAGVCRVVLRLPGCLRHLRARIGGLTRESLFCPAEASLDLTEQALPGESRLFGRSLQVRILGPSLMAVPLPTVTAAHIWRAGLSLSLDAAEEEAFSEYGSQRPVLSVAGPETPDSLLDPAGEIVLWHVDHTGQTWSDQSCRIGQIGQDIPTGPPFPSYLDRLGEVAKRLPSCLTPAHVVALTAMPRTAEGAADRQALTLLPIADEDLLARYAKRTRATDCGTTLDSSGVFNHRISVLNKSSASGPGGPLLYQTPERRLFPAYPPPPGLLGRGVLLAPDRFWVALNTAGAFGLNLLRTITSATGTSLLLTETDANVLPSATAFVSHTVPALSAVPGLLSGIVGEGTRRFGRVFAGLLWVAGDKDCSLEADLLGHLGATLDGHFPGSLLLCAHLRSPTHPDSYTGRAGIAGAFFDRLCDQATARNAGCPYSTTVVSLRAPERDDTYPAESDRAVALLLRALGTDRDCVVTDVSFTEAASSGHMPGFAYPIRYLAHEASRIPESLPHPLVLQAGLPVPAALVEAESENHWPNGSVTSCSTTMSGESSVPEASGTALCARGKMHEIWSRVLHVEHPDPEANFFDLGGTSVVIPLLRNDILDTFGVDIGMVGVFTYANLKDLSTFVLSKVAGSANENQDTGTAVDRDSRARAREAARVRRKLQRKERI